MSQIVVNDLFFGFGEEQVLKKLDFSCEVGEFVCFLGASGCGKSTLLRLLAGLLKPSTGSISLGGRDPRSANDIGFVFQSPTLCPWRTTLDNVRLPLQLRGQGSASTRLAREALCGVGLDEADARKLPAQLSGGMQMRASFARALVTKPQVMLMDEPFSALDEVRRQQLGETCLAAWKRQTWTTVFVTHNVTEAVFMSQRIYILSPRPASIVDRVDVPFEHRDAALRTSLDFLRFVSETSQRLRAAFEKVPRRAS